MNSRWMNSRRSLLVIALILFIGLTGCQTDPSGPSSGPTAPPTALAVSPATGTPGTTIALLGLDPQLLAADIGQMTALIGGLAAPLSLSPTGQLLAMVPLLAAGADGQSPPAAASNVEVLDTGITVASAPSSFTVTALPAATGSARAIQTNLGSIHTELGRITELLSPTVGVEEQWTTSFANGLGDLFHGSDPRSLDSVLARLEQESPASLNLIDSYLVSTGALAAFDNFATQLSTLAVSLAAADTVRGNKTATVQQTLARKMQFHSLLKLFGETVVHDTAEQFAYTVGLAAGAIGVARGVPAAAEVAAILAVADFAVNKVVVGLYPSIITDFHIELGNPNVNLGSTTTAQVLLTARNDPPGVGIQDFVSLTLALVGLRATPDIETFRGILLSTASFYLSAVQQFIGTYAGVYPGANLDVNMAVVPRLTWETVITDPRLVNCESSTPSTITGMTDQVNWLASSSTVGAGRISARTAVGSQTLLLTLPPLVTYSGGAFGEQVMATSTVSVNVVGQLGMTVDFPTTVVAGEGTQLTVHAGYLSPATGTIIGTPGIALSLIVDGGTVADLTGTTNSGGDFTTIATLDPDSTQIIISVTATGADSSRLTRSVSAGATPPTNVVLLGEGIQIPWAYVVTAANPPRNNSNTQQWNENRIYVFPETPPTVSLAAATTGFDDATASATLNYSVSHSVSNVDRTLTASFSSTSSVDLSYSVLDTSNYRATAETYAKFQGSLSFEVQGDSVSYTMNFTNPPDIEASLWLHGPGRGAIPPMRTAGSVSGFLQPGTYTMGALTMARTKIESNRRPMHNTDTLTDALTTSYSLTVSY